MKTIRGAYPPEKIKRLVRHTKNCIAGKEPDEYGIAAKYWSAVAYSLFDSIFSAFLAKSSHRVDDLGQSWKDLQPETKAYSRPDARTGLTLYDNRAVRNPELRVRPTLPPAVSKQWGGRWFGLYLYIQAKGGTDAKQIAGGSTWDFFKGQGYPTLIGLTKDLKLPILNRTGALQRSLFPSPLVGGLYVPLDQNQIFDIKPGKLTIGTKRPGVTKIDEARPLWPKKIGKWLNKASGEGRDCLYEYLPDVLTRFR